MRLPMPALVVALRTFHSGLIMAEPLTAAEVSAIAQHSEQALVGIAQRTRALLENDSAERLHRRFAEIAQAEIRRLELTLDPPKREPAWQESVVLILDVVFWQEGVKPMLHHAAVPGTEVHVMANDAATVERRVLDHLRLLLLRKGVGLRSLAAAAQTASTTLSEATPEPKIKTPRQRAEVEAGKKEEAGVLASIATDLTVKGSATDSAFELEASLRLLADALGGSEPSSVLIIGPPGVGKSALVHQFARQQRELGFATTPLWSTSAARLIAGQSGFGMWQERCRDMIREAAKTKAIIHLGNLWELMEVGKFIGNTQSIAAYLRAAIARRELLCIAECTAEQFAIIERSEPHLASVFHALHLAEPTLEITRRILGAAHDGWARKVRSSKSAAATLGDARVDPTFAALDWLHRLHQRYTTYSANPGRPLRFLRRLMLDRERGLALTPAEVTTAFTRETGLPALLLDDAVPLDVAATRDWFAQRVLGQGEAVEAIVSVLATIKTRLNRPGLPLASLLFIGPTGTGKTELAKSLATFLFGNIDRLARFDLNEFSDAHSVQRLIGGPAVGSAEGLLTARVREHPFSVLLFDEFEKADAAFFDLLLQVLGDGRLTDASGRVADFSNTVIIMTSNLGARDFQRGSIGFGTLSGSDSSKAAVADESQHFASAVRDFLRPEIYNRLGGIVPFHALSRDLAAKVLHRHLALLLQRDGLKLNDVTLALDDNVEAWLLQRGFDHRYGARPLKRVLERSLMTPVAEALADIAPTRRMGCTVSVAVSATGKDLNVKAKARKKDDEAIATTEARLTLALEAQRLRRSADSLRKCHAIADMENELPLLWQTERRIAAKPKGKPTPAEALALHRLASIREFITRLETCTQTLAECETELLHAIHRNTRIEAAIATSDLAVLRDELQQLRRQVLITAQPDHGDAMVILIADQRDWLQLVARVYLRVATAMAARLTALDYIVPPSANAPSTSAQRVSARWTEPFLHEAPPHFVGLLLRFQGELVLPCFNAERGLHVLEHNSTSRCYVYGYAGSAWSRYSPPAEAHRAAFLQDKALAHRRVFKVADERVIDSMQGLRSITAKSIERTMQNLIEEQLQRQIEEVAP